MTARGVSRRRLVTVAFGSATLGAGWFTGLSVLAVGRRTQILVAGSGTWQVVLIEHRSRRVVFVSGAFESFPEEAMRHLLGALRPRVDLLAATGEHLARMPESLWEWRSLGVRLALDQATVSGDPRRNIGIGIGIRLRIGSFDIETTPLVSQAWNSSSPRLSWISHVFAGDLVIAIAPTIDDIARHGDPGSILAISPSGNLDLLSRILPHVAIATNARTVEEFLSQQETRDIDAVSTLVARTFPGDIATIEFGGDGLHLPDWSERIHLGR